MDPFKGDVYSDEERRDYCSWPEAAQDMLDRAWTMGVWELLAKVHDLHGDAADRLVRLIQNVLIGRFSELSELPGLIEEATGLPADESKKIAATIANTILIPFNAMLQRWPADIRVLYDEWAYGLRR